MQELEQVINLYHTGFIVCLIMGIVFLFTTIILFFKFNVRKIIDVRTGHGAKKTIRQMEEINAKTGKLRQSITSEMTTDVLLPKFSQAEKEEVLERPEKLPGLFKIEKNVMWIHTDEKI